MSFEKVDCFGADEERGALGALTGHDPPVDDEDVFRGANGDADVDLCIGHSGFRRVSVLRRWGALILTGGVAFDAGTGCGARGKEDVGESAQNQPIVVEKGEDYLLRMSIWRCRDEAGLKCSDEAASKL